MRINIKTLLSSMALVLPVTGYADPVVPATQPLFLEGAVKHNLMLGIDDSGSMDFETLFPTNDGALWLNDDGTFVNSDGTFVDDTQHPKYTYLFPNGSSSSYANGSAILASGHHAVPPIKAYAFARSSEYNRAYYDPAETYRPWPTYGGFSFSEYDGGAAPYDPFKTGSTLNLIANFDTSTKADAEWDFDIEDADMVCNNSGDTCPVGDEDYTFYPATYWVVDNSSTYTFNPDLANGGAFYQTNSALLEAENGALTGDYRKASADSSVYETALVDTASGSDYIASLSGAANDAPESTYGQAEFKFSVPESGEYHIWVRKRSADGNTDSLWVNLFGYGATELTVALADNPFITAADGEEWIKWWQNWKLGGDWTWDKLASVTLTAGVTETLRIRAREIFVPVDQILITKEDSFAPSGAVQLLSEPTYTTRDCSVEADIKSEYYNVFRKSPGAFSGIDALGPDGQCLKKIEIKSSVASYPSGRSYADELQNFSNWFTYYRRRHQAMRGGVGAAFQGISGIQAGIYWLNDQRTVEMYDLDDTTDLTSFLDDHYKHVSSGGTPLRDALDHARTEFQRTGTSAPIQRECQKNFTLLFTDGFAQNETISGIGNADEKAGVPYADSYSSTLADIAYKMYTENPRADVTPLGQVRVPASCNDDTPPASEDCNSNLHVNTYTVGLGARGTIFDVTHDNVQDAYDTPPTWPDVSAIRDRRQIDDLYHAAVNGRGEIFNARTPATLRTELSAALRDIISSFGSASGVTFNSATLESDSLIFSAVFNSTAWSGDVEARELDAATGAIAADPVWKAAEVLDAQTPNARTILTYSNDSQDGIAFRWDAVNDPLDAGQKADLQTAPNGSQDALGQDRVAYLRGSTADEGQQFRNRDGLLGDIVSSTPLYVGAPRLDWPDSLPFGDDTHPYSAFRGDETNVNRTPIIYVGANDGMLHGFKAVDSAAEGGGEEVLAYIPRSVFSDSAKAGLHYLTDPAYRHRYYVDLSPQAVDAFIPSVTGGTAAWRTVLIGGLRGGGTGLFALDITDPSSFSEGNAGDIVLWEFDESDAPELNYILEQPVATMMNDNRWALLFGNGLNNGDGTNAADDKTGLFVLYLDGGLDGVWTAGTDYKFIEVGSTGGLGAINAIDTNGDRITDRIYGGDLEGNLWVFDVSNKNPSKWVSAFTSGGVAAPLFTAYEDLDGDGTSVRQPITMRPLVLRNTLSPSGEEGGNGEDFLVYFGTGKYFESGDPSDTSPQSMYGIWDRGDGQLTRDALLQEQTITTTGNLRNVSTNDIDWTGSVDREYGWFMDLPESGERVLNSPKFRGEILFFETYTPNSNPCDAGGSSWFMSVRMDGSQPSFATFDVNNDGQITSDDGVYAGQRIDDSSTGATGILGENQYYQDEQGNPKKRKVDYGKDTNRTGRLGWHELTNF